MQHSAILNQIMQCLCMSDGLPHLSIRRDVVVVVEGGNVVFGNILSRVLT